MEVQQDPTTTHPAGKVKPPVSPDAEEKDAVADLIMRLSQTAAASQ